MTVTDRKADIAVIGGTGFYKFLDDVTEIQVNTPTVSHLIEYPRVAFRQEDCFPTKTWKAAPVPASYGKLQGQFVGT